MALNITILAVVILFLCLVAGCSYRSSLVKRKSEDKLLHKPNKKDYNKLV